MLVHAHFDVVVAVQSAKWHLGLGMARETFPQVIQPGGQELHWPL